MADLTLPYDYPEGGLNEPDTSGPSMTYPDLSESMVRVINGTAPGLFDKADAIKMPGEDWLSALSRAMSAVAMTQQQRQLMAINLERAKKGQPPIDISQYSGIGVNVGISSSTQQTILMIGAGVLLYMLLSKR